MKIHEIISENDLAKAAVQAVATPLGKHTALTGVEKGAHAVHELDPTVQSALMAVPGLVNAVANFAKDAKGVRNPTGASVEALKAFLPFLKNNPAAFDAINSMLGNSSIAAEFAHLISKVAPAAINSKFAAVRSMAPALNQVAPALGSMAQAMTPVTMLTAPALAAGEYKKKVDADPFNKEFDNNPYAMSVRDAQQGKTSTLSQNAMANRRNAAKTFSTGGNPQLPQS